MDRKPIFDIPAMRLRTVKDIEAQIVYLEDKKIELQGIEVGFFGKIWVKLNNKKTLIGLGLMLTGGAMTQITAVAVLGQALFYVGSSIFGVGGAHKVLKALPKIGTTEKEKGKFDFSDILQILIDILNRILQTITK